MTLPEIVSAKSNGGRRVDRLVRLVVRDLIPAVPRLTPTKTFASLSPIARFGASDVLVVLERHVLLADYEVSPAAEVGRTRRSTSIRAARGRSQVPVIDPSGRRRWRRVRSASSIDSA